MPYVAVDEAKRALFSTAKLKSFDFVVYSKTGPNLLVDVKGRSCRNRAPAAVSKPGLPSRTSPICSNGNKFSATVSKPY